MNGLPSWFGEALCREYDPELFFPISNAEAASEPAKAVCRRCPSIALCGDWALEAGEPNGVWGGMSERTRRGIGGPARRRPRAGQAPRA